LWALWTAADDDGSTALHAWARWRAVGVCACTCVGPAALVLRLLYSTAVASVRLYVRRVNVLGCVGVPQ
jgi:hypothetical protein